MNKPAGHEKVLRACVVHGGKVIEEQRLPRRARLSIGSGPKNTFILSDPLLPKTHRLFDVRGGHYHLVLTESMRGKLSTETESTPVDFATLKAQGLLKKRGDYYVLPLHEQHRGKVVIGDIAVIFQFVTPPPKPPAPVLPEAARVSLWRRLDWGMVAAFAAILAVETPVLVAVSLQPTGGKEVTLETMDERWAQLIVPDRVQIETKAPAEASAGRSGAVERERSKKAAEGEPQGESARATAKAARTAEIRKSIASKGILAVLGTAGEGSSSGAVAAVLGEGGLGGDLDSAFEGISGVGLGTGSERTTRGSGTGESATIASLATAGGSAVGLGGKQEARLGLVKTEAPEVDGALDGEAIARVVRSRMRMVQDCYERELKRNPQLAGKIEIEFTIGPDGSIQDVRVAVNKMGSEEVAACIVGRIQRWKFPKPDGGSVTVNFPFIFTPSG